MIRVYFINFDYYAQDTFDTLDQAKAFMRDKSFESRAEIDGRIVATYSPISGFQTLEKPRYCSQCDLAYPSNVTKCPKGHT